MKHILVCALTVVLASLCLARADTQQTLIPSQTANPESGIAEKIIGTWRLVAIDDHRPNPPEREYNPTGYIMYDSTGHMAVQITRRNDRAKFTSEEITRFTTEEKAAAFSSYGAYYGTYTINEAAGTITHHVEGSLTPNDVGKNFVRYFKLSGNRITLNAGRDECQIRDKCTVTKPDLGTGELGTLMKRCPTCNRVDAEPRFDPLRSDPRFTDLMRRMGLPQ